MRNLGRASAVLSRLRRRAWGSVASLLAVGFAVSCGLSPVDDLPSAVDGLTVDGNTDSPGLDIGAGAGGASASGGGPGFCQSTVQVECRGTELWRAGVTSTCLYESVLLDALCEAGCVDEPDDGGAHCLGWGGAGGDGGAGGAAGATSLDDGAP